MNLKTGRQPRVRVILASLGLLVGCIGQVGYAQKFDFEKLRQAIDSYSVVIDMKVEFSYGVHTNEVQDRLLGTVVTEDGLVMFNGAALASDNAFSSFAGFAVRTTPTSIEISTFDGQRFKGEYVGVDRFTRIGFLKIIAEENQKFTPVHFRQERQFQVGSWLALYMLLPEFVTPPVAADVGMISTIVQSPEFFPLTVGFNALQLTSVLFDEQLQPVGVLGMLNDPSTGSMDPGGMLDSFDQMGFPLLGIVTGDRLAELIADPPEKGKLDRGWLGITLQALTEDISEFWDLDAAGGIIVNDVVKNSPAAQAGLEIGDIIYQVNGQPVEVDKEEKIPVFQRFISELGPGTPVEFSVIRIGEEGVADTMQLLATLKSAPLAATEAPEYENKALEFKVRDLVFADYLLYNLDSESFHGVVVSELKQGGLAALEGLSIGDVIQRIDNGVVESVEDVKPIMEEIEQKKLEEIIFFVWRDNRTLFVNVKTNW
ncbi:MAG: PDZ domain-containing protein [Candidatus Zixiibacteriota bacterium]|nr:MAG: PDZ domain-containing protein [candidate division Zixibacteria bacterium]